MVIQGNIHTILQEKEILTRVEWSPDGLWLACGSNQGVLFIIDVHTSTIHSRCEAHNGYISCLAWAPDSQHLLVGYKNQMVVIYDIAAKSGRDLYAHGEQDQDAWLLDCTWSSDGSMLASSGWEPRASVQIRDAQSGERLSTFFPREPFDSVQALAEATGLEGYQPSFDRLFWSPDGQQLAFGQEYKLHLWSPALDTLSISTRPVAHLLPPESQEAPLVMRDITWSPETDNLAIACLKDIVIWSIEHQQTQLVYQQHDRYVYKVMWFPDGRKMLSVDGSNVHIWDIHHDECIARAEFPETTGKVVFDATISPDLQSIAFVGQTKDTTGNQKGALWIGRHQLW